MTCHDSATIIHTKFQTVGWVIFNLLYAECQTNRETGGPEDDCMPYLYNYERNYKFSRKPGI